VKPYRTAVADNRRWAGFTPRPGDVFVCTPAKRCTFESMQARGNAIGPFDRLFEGGAKSFIFKGTNGRWRDVLTPDELASYAARVAEVLPPAAGVWLERARRAVDPRTS